MEKITFGSKVSSVKRPIAFIMVMALSLCMMSVVAFAATPSTAITSEMLEPVVDSITANLAVILPIAVVIFGIMIGVGLVPRIFKKFTKG